jgi:hypothetical protein
MINKLDQLLANLETKIPFAAHASEKISAVNIGWHIDHLLLVNEKITDTLIASDPANRKKKFNRRKFFVFFTNKMPRGRGKAPRSVQPKEEKTTEQLQEKLAATREKMKSLLNLHANSNFDHPYFGNLNLYETVKFLCIHTKHHIHIIDDILKQAQCNPST